MKKHYTPYLGECFVDGSVVYRCITDVDDICGDQLEFDRLEWDEYFKDHMYVDRVWLTFDELDALAGLR